MKEKTRKQTAAALIVTSVPLLYYGFSNFEAGSSEPLKAIAISLGCTGGLGFFFGGLYMLFKKGQGLAPERVAEIKKNNQKAVKEFADKIRNETKEEIINKKQKVNKMATLTPAEKMNKLDELIEENNSFEKIIATNKKAQAEMRADIKEDGFEQNEDGIWVPIKKKPVA